MFKSGFIPYGWSFLEDGDIEAVSHAMRQEIITTGPTVAAFEEAFTKAVGVKRAVSCNSGTAALHLAGAAAGLGPGDVLIVPSMTFVASANAARYQGADVVIADVDPDSGLLTPDTLLEALDRAGDRHVKTVCVVHMNGLVADSEAIHAITDQRGLSVIEDACHAIGSTYETTTRESNEPRTCRVGECVHSDFAAFSFHPVKTITTGEGGMVTAKEDAQAEHMINLRTHGIRREPERMRNPELAFDANGDLNPWYYEMHDLGHNFRLTDFQCALGISQLGKLERFGARRRQLMRMYDERLAPLAPLVKPLPRRAGTDPCLHLYPLLFDFKQLSIDKAELIRGLRAKKVGSQVHYIPVHCQPYYQDHCGKLDLPGAMSYYERVLSIPFYPAMQDEHVDYVVDSIRDVLGL